MRKLTLSIVILLAIGVIFKIYSDKRKIDSLVDEIEILIEEVDYQERLINNYAKDLSWDIVGAVREEKLSRDTMTN